VLSIDVGSALLEARRARLASSAVWAVAGMLRGLTLDADPARSAWLATAVAMLVCGVVAARLPRISRSVSLTVLALQWLAVIAAAWLSTAALAASGRPFAPFAGVKLLMLAVPLLVPSSVLGGGLLVAAVAAVLGQLSTWSPELRTQVFIAEPGISITTAVAAFMMLVARRRFAARLRVAAGVHAKATWFARLARLALLVRGLSRATVEDLRGAITQLTPSPDTESLANKMGNAVTRLENLSQMLAVVEWAPAAPTHDRSWTVDLSLVEREVNDLLAHPPPSSAEARVAGDSA
jgi:hypothetical protein